MLLALPLISAFAFALSTTSLAKQLGLSTLPLAIIMGIVVGNLWHKHPLSGRADICFSLCKTQLLRFGIILFGSHLTLQQLVAVGWQAAILDITMISSVLGVGYWIGVKKLSMSREETILTSVGSAVCGAAAILATEPVLKARQQDVSVAVATVVVFGTLALFCYPIIYTFLPIDGAQFGVYIGGTIHEVAQAVAAGQAISPEAMNTAIIVKLMRVMFLAPVVVIIAWLYQRTHRSTQQTHSSTIPVPWFVFGFIAMVAANSWMQLPAQCIDALQLLAQICLTIAMAALGLQTRFSAIRAAGLRPLLLSSVLFILLIAGGLGIHCLLYSL